jgi:ubiquinone/menaquinone biosynthesis C-methylase UbiE
MSGTAYQETERNLQTRIRAHKEYANFTLEDWLQDWLGDVSGQRLLEVGCGDGNFFATYAQALGPGGMILGLDLGPDLLYKAREKARALPTPVLVFPWNYDHHPWPFLDEEMDIIIAPFSAYYTRDVSAWVEEALRVASRRSRLLLLGPTQDNARELYEFNEHLTGIKTVPETDSTTGKLEEYILPELRHRLGGGVARTILDRQLIFPSVAEFARYYQATLLYDRTCRALGRTIPFEEVMAAASQTNLRLSKQIICITALKG